MTMKRIIYLSLCILFVQVLGFAAFPAADENPPVGSWDGGERSISKSPVQLYVEGSTLYIERVTFLSDINICIGTGSAILYEGVLPVDVPVLEVELGNAASEVMWIIVKDGVGSYSMEFTIPQ